MESMEFRFVHVSYERDIHYDHCFHHFCHEHCDRHDCHDRHDRYDKCNRNDIHERYDEHHIDHNAVNDMISMCRAELSSEVHHVTLC